MFTRIKKLKFLNGSSLWLTLPDATNEQMREMFGTGFALQDKEKYSDSIIVQSEMTGLLYSLYKNYGVWRVGAGGAYEGNLLQREYDKEQFIKIFSKEVEAA